MQRMAHTVLCPIVPAATNHSVPPVHELALDVPGATDKKHLHVANRTDQTNQTNQAIQAKPSVSCAPRNEAREPTLRDIKVPPLDGSVLRHGLHPKTTQDLLSNTQLQYMFVVESQRGAPALFTLKGWFDKDNASWFESVARAHPQHGGTLDFRAEGYQPLQGFDELLKEYNQLVEEERVLSEDVEPAVEPVRKDHWKTTVRAIAQRQRWSKPTRMQWTLVAIDDQSLIVWAGPHRIVQQPGATIHLYLQPVTRSAMLKHVDARKSTGIVMEMMRALLPPRSGASKRFAGSANSSEYNSVPTETELTSTPPSIMIDESLGPSMVAALRRQSWAIVPLPRRVELIQPFYKAHLSAQPALHGQRLPTRQHAPNEPDLSSHRPPTNVSPTRHTARMPEPHHLSNHDASQHHIHTERATTSTNSIAPTNAPTTPHPVCSPLECPAGVLACCNASAPIVQSLWRELYTNIPADVAHVCFAPPCYNRYEDDDHDMTVPPHIDYPACSSMSLRSP